MSEEDPLALAVRELRYAAAAIENAARLVTESEAEPRASEGKQQLSTWQNDLLDAHSTLEKICAGLEKSGTSE